MAVNVVNAVAFPHPIHVHAFNPPPLPPVIVPLNPTTTTTTPHHAHLSWMPNPHIPPPRPRRLPQALKSFHLFPALPAELRLRIWQFASGEARIVEIRSWGDTLRNPFIPIKFSVAPNYRHPITLSVCQESRKEALRHYKHIRIGVSSAVLEPGKSYVSWDSHPAFRVRGTVFTPAREYPLAVPRKPVDVYLNFDLDTIYLGPEFRPHHLERFLTTLNEGYEFDGLQYLAMDRKLWVYAENGRFEELCKSLYALRSRPLEEIYVVPDDEKNFLKDRYYYQKHSIDFVEPSWVYKFRPVTQEDTANTKPVIEALNSWFESVWRKEGKKTAPTVKVMSVRRNGHQMRVGGEGFIEAMWEIQKALGDMRLWKNWTPTSEAS